MPGLAGIGLSLSWALIQRKKFSHRRIKEELIYILFIKATKLCPCKPICTISWHAALFLSMWFMFTYCISQFLESGHKNVANFAVPGKTAFRLYFRSIQRKAIQANHSHAHLCLDARQVALLSSHCELNLSGVGQRGTLKMDLKLRGRRSGRDLEVELFMRILSPLDLH